MAVGCEEMPILTLNGEQLPLKIKIKYLGLMVSVESTMDVHANTLLGKRCGLVNSYRKSLESWDLTTSVKLQIMNTLINLVMRFGDEIHSSKLVENLEKVQHETLRIIFGRQRENHPGNDGLKALAGAKTNSLHAQTARIINKVKMPRSTHFVRIY